MKAMFAHISICFLFLICFICSCNEKEGDRKYIYLLTRSSATKEGSLVIKYNQYNVPISHVGIAFSKGKSALVYHIVYDDIPHSGSCLVAEPMQQFWNSPDPLDNRIWKIPVSKMEFKRSLSYVDSIRNIRLYYDFEDSTLEGMYCSEFVYNVLLNANKDRFIQVKQCVELNGILELIIGKESLYYYSADFFLNYRPILVDMGAFRDE